MLRLIKYSRDMKPEKRLYGRKPFSIVIYKDRDKKHAMSVCNN